MYILRGSRVLILPVYFVCLSLKIDFVLANRADHEDMRHFILVFTVCQSPGLGVSDLQRVNTQFTSNTLPGKLLPQKFRTTVKLCTNVAEDIFPACTACALL